MNLVELVLFAFKHAKQGDIFVQKALLQLLRILQK